MPTSEFTIPTDGSCEVATRRGSTIPTRFISLVFHPDVRRGVWSVLDQAIVSGTTFTTSVIVGRTCLPQELGVYYLAWSLMLAVRGLQDQIVSVPYMVLSPRRTGEMAPLFNGSMQVHQGVLSMIYVLGLLGFLVGNRWGSWETMLGPTIGVLLIAGPLVLLREHLRYMAIAHLKVQVAIAIDLLVGVLQIGSLLLLAYLGRLTVPSVYLVMGGACGAACLLWFLSHQQTLRFRRSQILADWWSAWLLGRWAVVTYLVGSSTGYMMPWLVFGFLSKEATGVLAAATTLVGIAGMLALGLNNFIFPRAAHAFVAGGCPALRRVLGATSGVMVVLLASFSLLIWLVGDRLAFAVYGSGYEGAGAVMTILAVATLATSLNAVAGNGLWAMARPKANFAADICILATTLPLALYLVPREGIRGAALAILAGAVAGAVVRGCILCLLMQSASRGGKG